jgi:hypothetical protein
VAGQQDKRYVPRSLNRRERDFDVSSLARMRESAKDTKRLIAGAKHEIGTSYALLDKIDRLLARW